MPTLEADDSMGIYATKNPGNVIVSPDKDMRQIPGTLFNMEESTLITAEAGAKWHLIQTMAGDNTDGYAGVPGVGVKRATSIFEEKGWSWKAVCETFHDKGYTEVTAIANARLARILTTDDWDYEKEEPILWTPTKDYEIK
jgi:DNA polymerase-1